MTYEPVTIMSGADPSSSRSFRVTRGYVDAALVQLYQSKSIRRTLQRRNQKLNLSSVGQQAQQELLQRDVKVTMEPMAVHEELMKGLPGQALFISAALAFDSIAEALPYFDVTPKTAWQKFTKLLTTAESEQALRLGRVATLATDLLGSPEAGREYLRTANFALGGASPLDLLRTAEGEQLVLNELQAQAAGGPV